MSYARNEYPNIKYEFSKEDYCTAFNLRLCVMYMCCVNPLLHSAHKSARIAKILILKLEGTIKKNSYQRRDYESVDEKRLCLRLCLE